MSLQGAKETVMQGAQYMTGTGTNNTSNTEEVSSGPLAGIQPEHSTSAIGSNASSRPLEGPGLAQHTSGTHVPGTAGLSSGSHAGVGQQDYASGTSSTPLTAYERSQQGSATGGSAAGGLSSGSLMGGEHAQHSSGVGSSGPIPGAGRQEGGSVAPIPGGHVTTGLASDGSEINTTRQAPGSQYWQETEEVGIFDTTDGRKTYAPDGHLTRTGAPSDGRRLEGQQYGDSDMTGGRGPGAGEGLDRLSSRDNNTSSREAPVADSTGPGAPRDQTNTDTAATQGNVNVPTSGDPGATDAPQRNEEGSGAGNKAGKSNKSTHLENPDAIPFAGDKKVGSDHFGESKLQPKAT